MELNNLQDLFVLKLSALYDIENELLKALPKMSKKATDPDLRAAFDEHRAETETQADRLKRIFEAIGEKPMKERCEGIRGIIADAESMIKAKPSPEILDASLVSSARYAEHYEMAGYLSAIAWARLLGYDDAVELLQASHDEEELADQKLAALADAKINESVAQDDIEDEEDNE